MDPAPEGGMRLDRFNQGDIWGGLSASALVLPQAMAFGITLWVPYTQNPASAALSGLITAACLCLAAGLARGTVGMVSAPTGPTLVLLSGSIAALAASGLTGESLITATLLTVLIGGIAQMLIGGFKLGHLIKYIPYPVVSGFMTGSAVLMIMSQSNAVIGGVPLEGLARWIPAITAGSTLLAMIVLPRVIRKLPGTVLGLIVGTVVYQLLAWSTQQELPAKWVVGQLPSVTEVQFGLNFAGLDAMPWMIIIGSALALAVLASLDSLLTSVVADVSTGARHNARRELIGQGIGHILASLSGGMAGAGTTGATLVAINSHGRYWVGAFTGLSFILLILFMGPIATILPISVFAGIILHVAILSMLDKDILLWLKTPSARIDGIIALTVTAITIFYDLMVAVGLGVALATIEFIRTQVQTAVIHRRWNINERMSIRRRAQHERDLLAANADAVIGYELKGILFFGTVDHLYETLMNDLKQTRYLLLDMRRVTQVDLTAIRLIEHMSGMLAEKRGELILAQAPKSMGLVKKEGHTNERLVPYHDHVHLRTFSDIEQAIEYAEERLLIDLGVSGAGSDQPVSLEHSELLKDFSDKQRQQVIAHFEFKSIKNSEYLFRGGDFGDEFFVILSGQFEILLPYSSKKKMRLAKFGPGMTFGEVAFLEPGPRTADCRASEDCEVAILGQASFQKLCEKHPRQGVLLLTKLSRDLSTNLRRADEALRRLVS